MALTNKIVSYDKLFKDNKKPSTIIVNDINALTDIKSAELVNETLYTIYNESYVEFRPSCNCGFYNTNFRRDKMCPKCNTICREENGSKPILWIRALDGLPFINAKFWSMVRYTIDSKVDVMRYLSDSSYNPPKKMDYLPALTAIVGERKYVSLIEKFEKVITYLKNVTKFKEKKMQDSLDGILYIWKNKKEDIFSNYLPIQNKNLFVMENTNKGRFINLLVSTTIDVVNGWLLFDENATDNKKNNLVSKTISTISESDKKIILDYFNGKKKMLRKQIYGFRVPMSFRSTITSIPREHDYEVIEIPYAVGLTAFEPMVLNLLVNRYKFKYLDAQKYIYDHVNKYDELLYSILETLVEESPYKGIPVFMQRNPTLMPGSILTVYGRFKKDATDYTVSVSKLLISIPNGKKTIKDKYDYLSTFIT